MHPYPITGHISSHQKKTFMREEGAGIFRVFNLFSGQEYEHIKHSYDIWHGAKNLAKKINKVVKIYLGSNIFSYLFKYY